MSIRSWRRRWRPSRRRGGRWRRRKRRRWRRKTSRGGKRRRISMEGEEEEKVD